MALWGLQFRYQSGDGHIIGSTRSWVLAYTFFNVDTKSDLLYSCVDSLVVCNLHMSIKSRYVDKAPNATGFKFNPKMDMDYCDKTI